MEKEELMKNILDHYEKIWALNYYSSISSWDSETSMPEGSAKERGEAASILTLMKKSLYTDKTFVDMVEKFYDVAETDKEKGMARVLIRNIIEYMVPDELLSEFQKTVVEAKVVWRNAKKKGEFNEFVPYLEKIVDLTKRRAEVLMDLYKEKLDREFKTHYDVLLDRYEEGVSSRTYDSIFKELKNRLKRILDAIMDSEWPSYHPLEWVDYDRRRMEELNTKVLNMVGFDWSYMALGESAHPFTIGIGIDDVRITTWYHERDFRKSLMATLHEFGHALYERQIDPSLRKTPVEGAPGLGIHESQSRFWENIVGRSGEFVSLITPLINNVLGIKADEEDLFFYFNLVRPGYIRTEADEVTYNFHIMIRYEIEKSLIEGKMDVKDVPETWNRMMEEYLGLVPPNDSLGALQDIHWSMGAIGYFPTYTLGNLIAAELLFLMEKDFDLYMYVEKGEFSPIRDWLKEKIHRHGSIYTSVELFEKIKGNRELDIKKFIDYLKEKYL